MIPFELGFSRVINDSERLGLMTCCSL